MTGAHGDFLSAWDQVGGQPRAMKLLKRAFEEAEGHDVVIVKETPNGTETTTKREYNFAPLLGILPYIARKMPETIEVDQVEDMTPAEIEARWGKRQDREDESVADKDADE